MAYSPNAIPVFPVGPIGYMAVLPSTAKTTFTDTTNAVKLVAAMANNRQSFGLIFAKPLITIVAGKLMLYLWDPTNSYLRCVDEVIHAAGTVSTTAQVDRIEFTNWTAAKPLIVPEGLELWIASAVAQTANSLHAHTQLGKVF